MPLFNKKFESKLIPARLSRCNNSCPLISEELDDYKQVSLNLGGKELRFVDGIWIHNNRRYETDDIQRLNRRLKSMEEQNNMTELKIEILLDLLTENVNEVNYLKLNKKVDNSPLKKLI